MSFICLKPPWSNFYYFYKLLCLDNKLNHGDKLTRDWKNYLKAKHMEMLHVKKEHLHFLLQLSFINSNASIGFFDLTKIAPSIFSTWYLLILELLIVKV